MNQTMTLWIATVILLLVLFALRMAKRLYSHSIHSHRFQHVIQLEKEANLIYCPGDYADTEDSDDL